MHLVGSGDDRIRATHAKTLELITGAAITGRATCVIAVSTNMPAQRMAGPVRLTVEAGDLYFGFDAEANSAWDPAGPSAVVRRGPLRLPGTLATLAGAAAADLPRDLAARLQDPATAVRLTVDARPSPPCVVIFGLDPTVPGDPRLVAELVAADVVVAADSEAARFVDDAHRGVDGIDRVEGRTLVITTDPLSGHGIPDTHGIAVQTVAMPPAVVAAAAAPWPGPVLIAATDDHRDLSDLLRRTPAGHRLVLRTDRRGLADVLRYAAEIRGSTHAVVARAYADPVLVPVEAPGEFPGADRLYVCPGPGDDASGVDPAVLAAVDGLLADGVQTRTAARALAGLAGWPQRRAYDAVLARRRNGPTLEE